MISSRWRFSSTRFLPSLINCFAVSKHTLCTFPMLLIVRQTRSRTICRSATETVTRDDSDAEALSDRIPVFCGLISCSCRPCTPCRCTAGIPAPIDPDDAANRVAAAGTAANRAAAAGTAANRVAAIGTAAALALIALVQVLALIALVGALALALLLLLVTMLTILTMLMRPCMVRPDLPTVLLAFSQGLRVDLDFHEFHQDILHIRGHVAVEIGAAEVAARVLPHPLLRVVAADTCPLPGLLRARAAVDVPLMRQRGALVGPLEEHAILAVVVVRLNPRVRRFWRQLAQARRHGAKRLEETVARRAAARRAQQGGRHEAGARC